jgi:hypothetical protein
MLNERKRAAKINEFDPWSSGGQIHISPSWMEYLSTA